MARIVSAIGRYWTGELSCLEAAEVLGMSERHFRRLRDRYEAEGAEGIIDRRRGKVSHRRVPLDRIEWVVEQYRTRYFDFTAKHFHEELKKQGYDLSYLGRGDREASIVIGNVGIGEIAIGSLNRGDPFQPQQRRHSLLKRAEYPLHPSSTSLRSAHNPTGQPTTAADI